MTEENEIKYKKLTELYIALESQIIFLQDKLTEIEHAMDICQVSDDEDNEI